MKLTTVWDTYFKPSAEVSEKLAREDMAFVKAGRDFPVLAYRQEKGHIVFTLDKDKCDLKELHPSGKNTYWVFSGAIEDPEGFSAKNQPKDEPTAIPSRDRGFPLILPGLTGTFYSNSPICPESPSFTWGEALHVDSNGRYRKPANASVTSRIILSAKVMQEVRNKLGKSIFINSWYRDPISNKKAGGATMSRHLSGDATDFRVEGMRPGDVYKALDGWWGNRGGLASSSVFTHIDVRGYRARWSYGF